MQLSWESSQKEDMDEATHQAFTDGRQAACDEYGIENDKLRAHIDSLRTELMQKTKQVTELQYSVCELEKHNGRLEDRLQEGEDSFIIDKWL